MAPNTSTVSVSSLQNYQLGLVIADLRRMVEVWSTLVTSRPHVASIKALIVKKIEDFISSGNTKGSDLTPSSFEDLTDICNRVMLMGDGHAVQVKISELCMQLLEQRMSRHPALDSDPPGPRSRAKTELQHLASLEQWVSIRSLLENTFDETGTTLERLRKVIAYDLRQTRFKAIASDDGTSLRVLGYAANIKRGTAGEDHLFIDRTIIGKISSLKGSKNLTFSSSSAPKKATTSQPALAVNANERVVGECKSSGHGCQGKIKELELAICRLEQENLAQQDVIANKVQNLETERSLLEQELADAKACHHMAITGLQEEMYGLRESGELLAEAIEDNKVLSKEIDKLSIEKAQVATECEAALQLVDEQRSVAGPVVEQLETENAQLSEELRNVQERLEGLEEDNMALLRAIDTFTADEAQYMAVAGGILGDLGAEKAALEDRVAILADEKSNLEHRIAAAFEELHSTKCSTTTTQTEALVAQNNWLWNEHIEANNRLGQIRACAGPGPMPCYSYPWFADADSGETASIPAELGRTDELSASDVGDEHSSELTLIPDIESFRWWPSKDTPRSPSPENNGRLAEVTLAAPDPGNAPE